MGGKVCFYHIYFSNIISVQPDSAEVYPYNQCAAFWLIIPMCDTNHMDVCMCLRKRVDISLHRSD